LAVLPQISGNREAPHLAPGVRCAGRRFITHRDETGRHFPQNALSFARIFREVREIEMNEDALNTSVRKFLKKVGITSQREIERAVREAVSSGRLKGQEALPAKAVVTIEALGLAFEIDGAVELD
jgi:hypothetical protein